MSFYITRNEGLIYLARSVKIDPIDFFLQMAAAATTTTSPFDAYSDERLLLFGHALLPYASGLDRKNYNDQREFYAGKRKTLALISKREKDNSVGPKLVRLKKRFREIRKKKEQKKKIVPLNHNEERLYELMTNELRHLT